MKKIRCIDCTWNDCKNLKRIRTIEIFFFVTTDDEFAIRYMFHREDFELWKDIISYHVDEVENFRIEDDLKLEKKLEEIENNDVYYKFFLISKDFNLYRNINLVFYFEGNREEISIEKALREDCWAN